MKTINTQKSKIIINQNITKTSDNYYSSYHLFNATTHTDLPTTALKEVNLIHLNKNRSFVQHIQKETTFCVIPVFGALVLKQSEDEIIPSGTTFLNTFNSESVLIFENPLESNKVSFLLIEINLKTKKTFYQWAKKTKKDMASLIPNTKTYSIHLIKMDGREELQRSINPNQQHYFYNPNSAFELNGCLLNPGDGLILNECSKLDCEALSNEAILFWFSFDKLH